MSRAVMSNLTLEIAEKSGIVPAAFLKNAALAYERIYFHPGLWGRLINFSDIEMLTGWACSDNEERARLSGDTRFVRIFAPASDVFSELETFNRKILHAEDQLPANALDCMVKIASDTYGVSEADVKKGVVGNTWRNIPAFALHDVLVLGKMREYDHEIMGLFATAHVMLLAAEIRARGVSGDPLGHLLVTDSAHEPSIFPNFGELSWDEIFELREDKRIKNFRRKLNEVAAGCLEFPRQNWTPLWREYILDLETLVHDVRPTPVKTGLVGALGLLHTPILNPVHWAHPWFDLLEERDRQSRYGWLYFVQQAKSFALRKPIS